MDCGCLPLYLYSNVIRPAPLLPSEHGLVFFVGELGVPGTTYGKPWLSLDDQVALLVSRGMTVGSVDIASRWLNVVGYYRLSGYWYPYRTPQGEGHPRLDSFRPGTSFEQVVALYVFDRRLKLLVIDALERVEIAMRVKVGHTLGKRGPFAHEDPAQLDARFSRSPQYSKWHARVQGEQARSREDFVKHFKTKYEGRLPVWAVTEILDFGSLSVLFSGLQRSDRDAVAAEFRVFGGDGSGNGAALAAWFRQLNIVRNIAAHHSRLWNRNIGDQPSPRMLAPIAALNSVTTEELSRLFGPLSLLAYLLDQVSPRSDWTRRISRLIVDELPATGRCHPEMGFPARWTDRPLWG